MVNIYRGKISCNRKMGIPSYFSYVLSKHNNVLLNVHTIKKTVSFTRLYMDCNSILYDCYHMLTNKGMDWEIILIEMTIKQIEQYIKQISPSEVLYIAFDGVAPLAKMEQQRNRRYKSWFETTMTQIVEKKNSDPLITTSSFTPGTLFMNTLSIKIRKAFVKQEIKYSVGKIYVGTPDDAGEGEHKLFQHMREQPCKSDESTAIYGLDADLMMLSLLHLSYSPQTYIFREAPHFAQSLLKDTNVHIKDPNELLFLHIANLSDSILQEMACAASDKHRINDYVFLCLFLGNDFLPHFPSLNIRTGGIQRLLDIYRLVIGSIPDRFLLSKSTPIRIEWREVSRFVMELATYENKFIQQEYSSRVQWDKKPVDLIIKKSNKEKLDLFQNTPVLYRKEERFIQPFEKGWEKRYYDTLFPANIAVLDICLNYLEGLEWVFKYYLEGSTHWRWKYKYHYPPLLKDLAPKVPHHNITFIKQKQDLPVHPYTQLAYVLPPKQHHLLPKPYRQELDKMNFYQYHDGYRTLPNGLPELTFQWAFCRYFWECHVDLPCILNDTLEKWDQMAVEVM